MTTALTAAARFRHVVFPGELSCPFVNRPSCAPAGRPASRRQIATVLDPQQHAFVTWLFTVTGVELRRYKPEMLGRRLPACLRAVRAETTSQAYRLLRNSPSLRRRALGALLIGVTQFFRDPPVFHYLANHLLPSARASDRTVRCWSAGCSDGAELYSVAMLMDDLGMLERSELLGTDCRGDAIERARVGWFDDRAIANIPLDLSQRYLASEGRGWRVSGTLRSAVHWRTSDVLSVLEPGAWDLVLCRNLAIYLQPDDASLLWRRLETALRPGGLLVLGKAERPLGARRLVPVEPCVYRRNGAADVG